jgi:tetratricopeptide (TPR) repeat protein
VRNLATAYFSLARYEEGLRWFRKALAEDPENYIARLGRARALKRRGWPALAYADYLHLLERDRRNTELREEAEKLAREIYGGGAERTAVAARSPAAAEGEAAGKGQRPEAPPGAAPSAPSARHGPALDEPPGFRERHLLPGAR